MADVRPSTNIHVLGMDDDPCYGVHKSGTCKDLAWKSMSRVVVCFCIIVLQRISASNFLIGAITILSYFIISLCSAIKDPHIALDLIKYLFPITSTC